MKDYWSKENIVETGAGIASCVKLLNKMFVFGAFDNFVYALNPDTGNIVWKFKTNGPVYSTPAVYKNRIYAGSCDGFLYCLDSSGNLSWKFDAHGRIMNTSVICANGKVFFGTDNGIFFTLDLDGRLLWKYQTGGAIRTTPAIINDKIIFGSHDHNLYCLNENGYKEWRFITGGNLWTCPLIISPDNKLLWSINNQHIAKSEEFLIYFGCFDGGLYCLDQTGNFVWKFHTNGPNTSGPEFQDGIIYFGSSDGYFYSVEQDTKKLNWKYKTHGRIGHSSPLVLKDDIFICDFLVDETTRSGDLLCLDKNGNMQWAFKTNDTIVSTPVVHNGVIFFGSWDGFLYAISLDKKELLWKFRTLYEKINFDSLRAVKHMETEEERSKSLLTTWTSEMPRQKQIQSPYEAQNVSYNKNVTLYGSSQDAAKFSYAADYRQKKKSAYEN
jgi:outer membrane protein assembly factor BamB